MQTSDTTELLRSAQEGDHSAVDELMTRYRDRLRRMIDVFLDPRISARVDSSDVLQEALACAASRLPEYLVDRPIAFYPWLRTFVRDELVRLHRRHVLAQRRTVHAEQPLGSMVTDDSVQLLAIQLVSSETSPSLKMAAKDLTEQVRAALATLPDSDREILLMRCVEQLSIKEIMAVAGIAESAAKSRLSRAFLKLGRVMGASQ